MKTEKEIAMEMVVGMITSLRNAVLILDTLSDDSRVMYVMETLDTDLKTAEDKLTEINSK